MYGGVRWEYCLEEWGAKSYFWGVLSKGVRRDIIGVSIELLPKITIAYWPGLKPIKAWTYFDLFFILNFLMST